MSAVFRCGGEQKSYQFASINHETLAEKSLSHQDSLPASVLQRAKLMSGGPARQVAQFKAAGGLTSLNPRRTLVRYVALIAVVVLALVTQAGGILLPSPLVATSVWVFGDSNVDTG